jgi:uncharacterized protein
MNDTLMLKACPLFEVKTDGEKGRFQALASTYDIDSVGDKVKPGAFAKTLADWSGKGDNIPLLWSHRMDDPDYNLGHVLDAKESAGGLWVDVQLDLDGAKAVQAYRLLRGKRINNLSFAYKEEDSSYVTGPDGKSYNELRQLKLYEVSLTPIGANQHTQVLGVKEAAQFLQSLNADTLSKADVVELAKALASTNTLLDQVLHRLPADDVKPEATKSGKATAMAMALELAALGG